MERTRFKTVEQETNATGTESRLRQAEKAMDFNSVEEVLRFDAAQVTPPAQLDDRVKKSLESESVPAKKSWWGKLFG